MQKRNAWNLPARRVGVVASALAFHQYGSGSLSCPAAICGLSLLVLYSTLL